MRAITNGTEVAAGQSLEHDHRASYLDLPAPVDVFDQVVVIPSWRSP
jgi:hypothetical protein